MGIAKLGVSGLLFLVSPICPSLEYVQDKWHNIGSELLNCGKFQLSEKQAECTTPDKYEGCCVFKNRLEYFTRCWLLCASSCLFWIGPWNLQSWHQNPNQRYAMLGKPARKKKRSFGIAQIRGDPCHTNIIIFFFWGGGKFTIRDILSDPSPISSFEIIIFTQFKQRKETHFLVPKKWKSCSEGGSNLGNV